MNYFLHKVRSRGLRSGLTVLGGRHLDLTPLCPMAVAERDVNGPQTKATVDNGRRHIAAKGGAPRTIELAFDR